MRHMFQSAMAAVLAGGVAFAVSAAQANDVEPAPAPPAVSPERLAGWIEELASDDFDTRIEAAEKLRGAGAPAAGPVAEAALTGDLDLATQCVAILESLHGSEDAAIKASAKAALEKLAKSDNKSVAERAEAIVNPPAPPANDFNGFNGRAIRIQIGGQIIAGQNRKTQIRVVNGKREIDIEEDGRKIHISDEEGKNIVVRTEETDAAGNKKTLEVKAKDLDELKKSPEAHRIYEQHTRNQAIRIQGNGIRIRQLPAVIPPLEAPDGDTAPEKK